MTSSVASAPYQLHAFIRTAVAEVVAADYPSTGQELPGAVRDRLHERVREDHVVVQYLFDHAPVRTGFAALIVPLEPDAWQEEYAGYFSEAVGKVLRRTVEIATQRWRLRSNQALVTGVADMLGQALVGYRPTGPGAFGPSGFEATFMFAYRSFVAQTDPDDYQRPTRTEVKLSVATAAPAEPFSVEVTVTGPNQEPAPGDVSVGVLGGPVRPFGLDGAGIASVPLSLDVLGPNSVVATYLPAEGSNYQESVGAAPVCIEAPATVTTIDPPAAPIVYGDAVTLSAVVIDEASSMPVAGASVRFLADGAVIGPAQMTDSAGRVTVTYQPAAGPHSIVARADAGAGHAGSEGAIGVCVDRATPTVVLSLLSPTVLDGQPVQLRATVTGPSPLMNAPTGTVVFVDDSDAALASGVLLAGAAAAAVISLPANPMPYPIRARYSGDSDYEPAEGAPVEQTVERQPSVMVLSVPTQVPASAPLLAVATVTSAVPGGPTGIVTFDLSGTKQDARLANGTATASLVAPNTAGTLTITASYEGDVRSAGATAQEDVDVQPAPVGGGVSAIDPARLLTGDPRYAQRAGVSLVHAATLFRALAYGDVMGIHDAYDELVRRWSSGSLPLTPLSPTINDQLHAQWRRCAPEKVVATRAELSALVFGLSPDLSGPPPSHEWAANSAFPTAWGQFVSAVVNRNCGKCDDRTKLRIEPLADRIVQNLTEVMTDSIIMRIKDLGRHVEARRSVLQDPTVLRALDSNAWQEAVAQLDATDRAERLTSLTSTGEIVHAMEKIFTELARPSGQRRLKKVIRRVVIIDTLSGPSGSGGQDARTLVPAT